MQPKSNTTLKERRDGDGNSKLMRILSCTGLKLAGYLMGQRYSMRMRGRSWRIILRRSWNRIWRRLIRKRRRRNEWIILMMSVIICFVWLIWGWGGGRSRGGRGEVFRVWFFWSIVCGGNEIAFRGLRVESWENLKICFRLLLFFGIWQFYCSHFSFWYQGNLLFRPINCLTSLPQAKFGLLSLFSSLSPLLPSSSSLWSPPHLSSNSQTLPIRPPSKPSSPFSPKQFFKTSSPPHSAHYQSHQSYNTPQPQSPPSDFKYSSSLFSLNPSQPHYWTPPHS